MITRRWIFESASFTVTVKMRLSVRPTYRRQEALLSRRSIMFTFCIQGPEAIQNSRAEVDSRTTRTTDGLPIGVALDVIVTVCGVGEVV
jgi:hypothetical protein